QAILRRFLGRLSPLADPSADDAGVCAVDLARRAAVFPEDRFRYRAAADGRELPVSVEADGRVCVRLEHKGGLGGIAEGDPRRYRVVSVWNGIAGPLELHLYDLDAGRGYFVAGLVRPGSTAIRHLPESRASRGGRR